MDNRIVADLVVCGSASHAIADLRSDCTAQVSATDFDLARFRSTFRSIATAQRFVAATRLKLGQNALIDYEMLINREALRQFMDRCEYSHQRDPEVGYITSVLDSTAGPVCSISVLALFRVLPTAFIGLDQHLNYDYICRTMIAAFALYKASCDVTSPPQTVDDGLIQGFIEAYYLSLLDSPPMSWPDRVSHSLSKCLSLHWPSSEPIHHFEPKVISGFSLGFCGPILTPHNGSLFSAQVKQGLAIALSLMPESICAYAQVQL